MEVIRPSTDDQHIRVIVRPSVVLSDRSTTNLPPYQVKNLESSDVLTDAELWDELPTATRTGVPLDRHMKTTFSVYKPRDIRVQPFLLIDRTCRIFTSSGVHARSVCSGCITTFRKRVAQDSTVFPAYSQVYRQRG